MRHGPLGTGHRPLFRFHQIFQTNVTATLLVRLTEELLEDADTLMYEAKRHRNAWAGLLDPNTAATSFDFDHGSIDPTSMLLSP